MPRKAFCSSRIELGQLPGRLHAQGSSKWNSVTMGQAALTGRARGAAQPVVRAVARRTGRPEAEVLALIGAVYLAIAFIAFLPTVDAVLPTVDAVIAAARAGCQPADGAPAEAQRVRPGELSKIGARLQAGITQCWRCHSGPGRRSLEHPAPDREARARGPGRGPSGQLIR